jgi:antibiotic biosynthesis monooxygenase (ABM) superfamily enzyme
MVEAYRRCFMVDEQLENPSRAPRWFAAVATTLAAWLVAFLVVTALLTVFGDQLGSLPLALRALVISGVLVAVMVNLVMPVVSAALGRALAGPPSTRLQVAGLKDGSGRESHA